MNDPIKINPKIKWVQTDATSGHFVTRVPTPSISKLQSIMESYESLGILRTMDQNEGLVMVMTTNDLKDEVLWLLESLREEGLI